ncbi:PAS domain-containing protein [Aliiglaciecola litoralis]|uniref:PAS domain-containing protein n=1 Tax=Aliiglaciecola litoralis TaxID=582857 RepID=A0ABN1LBW1_9ALTE
MLAEAVKTQDISDATIYANGNALPIGIMVSDLFGNISYTNPAYKDITGYSAEQSLGNLWAAQIHSLDKPRLA